MIKAKTIHREFFYHRPATTSRGTYTSKQVYFIELWNENEPHTSGLGECSLFPGLSFDDVPAFTDKLNDIISQINRGVFDFQTPLYDFPSIQFALETALLDLQVKGSKLLFPSDFTAGKDSIRINGLIWMGKRQDVESQIDLKLKQGFSCLKMKVGALDFDAEMEVLSRIRKNYSPSELEIRVDANGAFVPEEALEKLKRLADLGVHSIEQPIRQGQVEAMAKLCHSTPLPIALDEELIGIYPTQKKSELLEKIRPQYLILKPGLLGGLNACEEWIHQAGRLNIGWWITSSLETNIGLNAIAQWTYSLGHNMPHGLSTGALFANNIGSPLTLRGEHLFYDPIKEWMMNGLN
jgi:o-succinylbenzoate synthase